MPVACSAPARLGLSTVICGRVLRPECSPVTSSAGSIVTPLAVAHAVFWLISSLIAPVVMYWIAPSVLVWQIHGTTEKSWRQPRYRCDQVWFTQRNDARLASSESVSASGSAAV